MDALMLGVLLASIVRHERAMAIARSWQRPLNWLALCLIALQLGDFWGTAGEMWRLSLGGYITYLTLICVQYPLLNLAMACLLLNVFTRETGPMRWVLKSKALSAVGLISYGAYMYHQSINFALWRWLYNSEPLYKGWEYGYVPLLVLGLTGVVALASYKYLEIPLRNRIKAAAKPRGYGIATSADVKPA
jgi:peptidoglycan/LPS O-acetylase OafA/YrhL